MPYVNSCTIEYSIHTISNINKGLFFFYRNRCATGQPNVGWTNTLSNYIILQPQPAQ